MRLASIGNGLPPSREEWLRREPGYAGKIHPEDLESALREVDALFVGVPPDRRIEVASEAARAGAHVFLEWPPAVSLEECVAFLRLVEEAGLEAGVSRPLRFHETFRGIDWRADIVSMRLSGLRGDPADGLADLVDLASYLCGTASVLRVEAEAVGEHGVAAFGLRFHSGAYAQALIHQGETTPRLSVFAASPEGILNEDVALDLGGPVVEETKRFLDALTDDLPAPITIHDALPTLRVVERLRGTLT